VADGTTDVGTITVVQGKIIYGRAGDATAPAGTIWMMNGDGSGDTQVTVGHRPRLSPDGRWLVFLRDSADFSRGNVYVRDLESGTDTKVFDNFDFIVAFDWSADSERIVFDFVCSIYEMNRDGSNAHAIVSGNCYDDAPVRSPVDGTLAFHNTFSGLLLADANGANRRAVPNTAPGDYWPAWSPDGQWISFGRASADGQAIPNYFRIRPDGSGLTQLSFLTPGSGNTFFPGRSWSADGLWLVVPGTVDGVHRLYAIATDGGGGFFGIAPTPGTALDSVGSVVGSVVPPPPAP
jgi:Tol biopolymer transport system component